MDTAPEPFLLLEPEAAPRLEAVPPCCRQRSRFAGCVSPALAGVAILGIGIPVLWAAWLVSALFDRWGALGWAGLVDPGLWAWPDRRGHGPGTARSVGAAPG